MLLNCLILWFWCMEHVDAFVAWDLQHLTDQNQIFELWTDGICLAIHSQDCVQALVLALNAVVSCCLPPGTLTLTSCSITIWNLESAVWSVPPDHTFSLPRLPLVWALLLSSQIWSSQFFLWVHSLAVVCWLLEIKTSLFLVVLKCTVYPISNCAGNLCQWVCVHAPLWAHDIWLHLFSGVDGLNERDKQKTQRNIKTKNWTSQFFFNQWHSSWSSWDDLLH